MMSSSTSTTRIAGTVRRDASQTGLTSDRVHPCPVGVVSRLTGGMWIDLRVARVVHSLTPDALEDQAESAELATKSRVAHCMALKYYGDDQCRLDPHWGVTRRRGMDGTD